MLEQHRIHYSFFFRLSGNNDRDLLHNRIIKHQIKFLIFFLPGDDFILLYMYFFSLLSFLPQFCIITPCTCNYRVPIPVSCIADAYVRKKRSAARTITMRLMTSEHKRDKSRQTRGTRVGGNGIPSHSGRDHRSWPLQNVTSCQSPPTSRPLHYVHTSDTKTVLFTF